MEMMNLVKTHVILVLAGTGLDAIRYGDDSNRRVGTNPKYSRLVRMKGPNVKTLLDRNAVSREIMVAVDAGLFSKVLQTNARMFFRGVLPILSMKEHTTDNCSDSNEKEQRLIERLTSVASFGPLMDYSVRNYVNQNTVGELRRKDRDFLLGDAFLYHMITAIRNISVSAQNTGALQIQKTALDQASAFRQKRLQAAKIDEDRIFQVGLATESIPSSAALKYMACFGLTCRVRASFGHEFEELTALHCLRWMELKGYSCTRGYLRHVWPPQSHLKDDRIDVDAIKSLKLKEQSRTEEFHIPDETVPRACVVYSQGTATAQGGDVLVLCLDRKKRTGVVHSIQCKNYASYKANEIKSLWASLGIDLDANNLEPDQGKAGHSYAGLEAFRQSLQQLLGKNMHLSLGLRIMACSFKMPPRAPCLKPNNDNAVFWFREMLEPTISTFSLNSRT